MVTITINDDEARDLRSILALNITIPKALDADPFLSQDDVDRIADTQDRLYKQLDMLLNP